jgi:hypothetical protein
MFGTGGMIDHPIRYIVLVLSITFAIPLLGAIAGAIVTSLAALHKERKETEVFPQELRKSLQIGQGVLEKL